MIVRHIAEYQWEKLKYWFQLLLNHIYFTNSLWPTDAIWRHWCGYTLAQVMAWCLMAPSHYLNQCWLLMNEVLWYSSESNSTSRAQAIILHNELELIFWKLLSYHSGATVLSLFTPRTKHLCTHEKFSIMEYVRVHHNISLSMACNALTSIKWNAYWVSCGSRIGSSIYLIIFSRF